MRFKRLMAAGAGLLLAIQLVGAPVAAAASTPLTITADDPAAVPTGHLWTFNDFFPRTLTVHRGQEITLAIAGFHTITLLPAGMSPTKGLHTLGLVQPDTDDTTPNPNGSTHTILALGAAFPAPGGCGTSGNPCTYNGSSPVSTGAPLAGPVPPTTVKVTAPVGTYRFICLIHPKMTGWLNVAPASKPATTRAQAKAKIAAQVKADRRAGFFAEAVANVAHFRKNSDGTRTWVVTAGTGSPDGRVAVDEMLPRRLPIHKGDRVTWVSRSVNEIHTVTFPMDLQTEMLPECESGGVDIPATPTVIPPTGPQDFACGGGPVDEFENGGGNGVRHVTSPTTVSDSGIIANAPTVAGFGVPATSAKATWTVSFAGATKGTYHFVCQVHDGMVGTIVVH